MNEDLDSMEDLMAFLKRMDAELGEPAGEPDDVETHKIGFIERGKRLLRSISKPEYSVNTWLRHEAKSFIKDIGIMETYLEDVNRYGKFPVHPPKA